MFGLRPRNRRVMEAALALVATLAGGPALRGDAVAVRSRLLLLPAPGCDVRYSPGSLDRGATVQEWLCELAAGGARTTGRPTALQGLILTRDEWVEAGLACTYGLPCVVAPGVLALPAAGDPGTIELWRGALGSLPTLPGTPFVGTAEEAASLAPADAFAAALAAHELAAASDFTVEEPWMLDMLGHVIFIDAARQGGLGRGEALGDFWMAVRRRGSEAAAAGGPLSVELFRQSRLFGAAQAVAGSDRRLPGRQLRRMQEKAGGTLRVADLRKEWPNAIGALDGITAAAAY